METFGYDIVEIVEDTVGVENGDQSTLVNVEGKKAIWLGKKSAKHRALDEEATGTFLGLVKQHWDILNDNKTKKKVVWKIISDALENAGYDLGDNPTLKVEQKWHNVSKSYKNYVKELENGEATTSCQPLFFAELKDMIGEVHSIQPVYLVDPIMEPEKSSGNKRRSSKPSTNNIELANSGLEEESSGEEEEFDEGTARPSKRRKTSKASDLERVVSLLLESQKKSEDERKKKAEWAQRKEENAKKRHNEMMGVLTTMSGLLQNLVDSVTERRRSRNRYTSDSDRILELLEQSQRRKEEERVRDRRERQEREKRRDEREKQREENQQKRHEEVMKATNTMVALLNRVADSMSGSGTRDSSDSD